MEPSTRRKVEQSGDVRIVRFAGLKKINPEDMLADELIGCTENLNNCHLLLDFTNVEQIHSMELGTLVGLHKKLVAAGGKLTLFNVSSHIFDIFAATRLDTLLAICREPNQTLVF
jgi:anti-anti-sigma factor